MNRWILQTLTPCNNIKYIAPHSAWIAVSFQKRLFSPWKNIHPYCHFMLSKCGAKCIALDSDNQIRNSLMDSPQQKFQSKGVAILICQVLLLAPPNSMRYVLDKKTRVFIAVALLVSCWCRCRSDAWSREMLQINFLAFAMHDSLWINWTLLIDSVCHSRKNSWTLHSGLVWLQCFPAVKCSYGDFWFTHFALYVWLFSCVPVHYSFDDDLTGRIMENESFWAPFSCYHQ